MTNHKVSISLLTFILLAAGLLMQPYSIFPKQQAAFATNSVDSSVEPSEPVGSDSLQTSSDSNARTVPKSGETSRKTKKTREESIIPATSKPSESGLLITDFLISEKTYRSARLTWRTNFPSSTKINYGTDKGNLKLEQKDDTPATEHSLQLDSKNIKAGSRYYIRVSSDDGKSPAVIDSDFYTEFIPVVIKVTDETEQPLKDVSINSGDAGGYTDEKGEALLELPEGDVVIYADKDGRQRELSTVIELPKTDNGELQRITMSLSQNSASASTTGKDKKGQQIAFAIAASVAVILLGLGIYIIIKRRNNLQVQSRGDPLEVENYTQHTIPSTAVPHPTTLRTSAPQHIPTIEPNFAPVQNPTLRQYASLPEMVGRYGTQSAAPPPTGVATIPLPQRETQQQYAAPPNQSVQPPAQPTLQPNPTPSPTTNQRIQPLLQQPPLHTSLKEMVNVYDPQINGPVTDQPINDLPVAPIQSQPEPQQELQQNDSPSYPPLPQQPDDGLINISH